MHPLRHPRNAAVLGVIFAITGAVYLIVQTIGKAEHPDYAGVTMLAVLGIAMALMAYVLAVGSPRD